ncbi:MAG TPA: hypothetical protein VNQ81_06110 [Povalibacter sp.]|nr:hypothetical protein [Povalibacter sp.]
MNARTRLTVALVTARAARGVDDDLLPLQQALHAAGVEVSIVDWDDDSVRWSRFDLALLRSTWDYMVRMEEFLAWIARAAQLTRLVNPPDLVRWSLDKHYLADLHAAGVPVVPSWFIEPGEAALPAIEKVLAGAAAAEFVVKPAIGAGSRDAQRYARADIGSMVAHAERLLGVGRAALLQPYLDRVDERGETALIFFAGEFSHAIRKGPLLQKGGEASTALFATEQITPRIPEAAELAVAERTIAAIKSGVPLYARVDLVHDEDGSPCVLELELVEPSLFFAHAPGSAERFVAAIQSRG